MDSIQDKILELLPNREKVLHLIWDNLEGPLDPALTEFIHSKIGDFGSWRQRSRGNGLLAYKGWIYNKRKQGHWIYMFKNGALHKDCYFRNNKYHGRCKLCEPNGSFEVNEYYKGRMNGVSLRYDKDGVLFQKWIYVMGKYTEIYGRTELGLINDTKNL